MHRLTLNLIAGIHLVSRERAKGREDSPQGGLWAPQEGDKVLLVFPATSQRMTAGIMGLLLQDSKKQATEGSETNHCVGSPGLEGVASLIFGSRWEMRHKDPPERARAHTGTQH